MDSSALDERGRMDANGIGDSRCGVATAVRVAAAQRGEADHASRATALRSAGPAATVSATAVLIDLETVWNGAMYRAGLAPGLSTWPDQQRTSGDRPR